MNSQPDTKGQRMAEATRQKCNKLTPAERRRCHQAALYLIGDPEMARKVWLTSPVAGQGNAA